MLIIEKMERLYFNIDKQKATKVTYSTYFVAMTTCLTPS